MPLIEILRNTVRAVPDFPKAGILFRDITPVLANPALSQEISEALRAYFENKGIEAIVGIESRGFLFGFPLAIALGVPFVMVRKKGKLPTKTLSHSYLLEYGEAEIEIQVDAIAPGTRVLIHDDLLATGGTAKATAELIQRTGAEIAGFSFIIELEALRGRQKLEVVSDHIHCLLPYS